MTTFTAARPATHAVETSHLLPEPVFGGSPLHHLSARIEPDPATFMRLLGLFALRGILPSAVQLRQHDGVAHLDVWARLDEEDFRVLCARAATLVGVHDCSTPDARTAARAVRTEGNPP